MEINSRKRNSKRRNGQQGEMGDSLTVYKLSTSVYIFFIVYDFPRVIYNLDVFGSGWFPTEQA